MKPPMTFSEIARELGITKRAAETAEKRALKKLRRRPRTLGRFQELVQFRRGLKDRGVTL